MKNIVRIASYEPEKHLAAVKKLGLSVLDIQNQEGLVALLENDASDQSVIGCLFYQRNPENFSISHFRMNAAEMKAGNLIERFIKTCENQAGERESIVFELPVGDLAYKKYFEMQGFFPSPEKNGKIKLSYLLNTFEIPLESLRAGVSVKPFKIHDCPALLTFATSYLPETRDALEDLLHNQASSLKGFIARQEEDIVGFLFYYEAHYKYIVSELGSDSVESAKLLLQKIIEKAELDLEKNHVQILPDVVLKHEPALEACQNFKLNEYSSVLYGFEITVRDYVLSTNLNFSPGLFTNMAIENRHGEIAKALQPYDANAKGRKPRLYGYIALEHTADASTPIAMLVYAKEKDHFKIIASAHNPRLQNHPALQALWEKVIEDCKQPGRLDRQYISFTPRHGDPAAQLAENAGFQEIHLKGTWRYALSPQRCKPEIALCDDFKGIAAFHNKNLSPGKWNAEDLEKELAERNGEIYAVKALGKYLGYFIAEPGETNETPYLKITDFFVLPSHQEEGIEKIMFNEIAMLSESRQKKYVDVAEMQDGHFEQILGTFGFIRSPDSYNFSGWRHAEDRRFYSFPYDISPFSIRSFSVDKFETYFPETEKPIPETWATTQDRDIPGMPPFSIRNHDITAHLSLSGKDEKGNFHYTIQTEQNNNPVHTNQFSSPHAFSAVCDAVQTILKDLKNDVSVLSIIANVQARLNGKSGNDRA